MNIQNLNISDGKIRRIISSASGVEVLFTDWQEDNWWIIFNDVLAYQAISPEEQETSHIEVVNDGALKNIAKKHFVDENLDMYKVYNFFRAWNEDIILIVVSLDAIVKRANIINLQE